MSAAKKKPAKKAPKKAKLALVLGHTAAGVARTLEQVAASAEAEGLDLTSWAPGATFLSDGPFDVVFDPEDVLSRVSTQAVRQVLERVADDVDFV